MGKILKVIQKLKMIDGHHSIAMNTEKIFGIYLVIIAFITLTNYTAIAQDRIAEIHNLVTYTQENGMFNGNILIAEDGQINYHKSLGIVDFANGSPLTKNKAFCLGSITKQFTAMGIMILQHEGKLRYSDKLEQYFPEFPKYLHQISIKNLMQHTSGLKRTHFENHDQLKNQEVYENLIQSASDKLLFEPGTDLSYSNTGFIILAMLVEKISGVTYEQFLTNNIFKPLGMTHSFVFTEDDRGRKDIAVGYDGFGNKADYTVLTYGSAGIYSTTEDLFRWYQSQTTDQIIPFQSKNKAFEPALSNSGKLLDHIIRDDTWSYGFGQFIYRGHLKGAIGHAGAFGGFFNIMIKDLINNRDVIVLTNNGRLLDIFAFGAAIQNILREQPYELPKISIDLAIREKAYENIDEGIEYYHKLKRESPDKYKFNNQWELNRLGYALMGDNRANDAIKIFKLLISEFPDKVNPYDSLGEAYFKDKQYKLSLKSYQKALNMNPNYDDAPHAKRMIEKIINIVGK